MKSRIVIHATNTPADMPLTLDDIMSINSEDRRADPMPYHYVVNVDGRIMKGKRDNELCGHCGKFSRDSLSVAYVGGLPDEPSAESRVAVGDCRLPMNGVQEEAMRVVVKNLVARNPGVKVTGANALMHPGEDPMDNEPYFDVERWWGEGC